MRIGRIGRRATRDEHRKVFTRIHATNAWGSAESVSGPGSTRARAATFLRDLIELLRRLNARSLLDAPCGAFSWIEEAADAVPSYLGVDVVPDIIAANAESHSRAGRSFQCLDLTRDALPRSDVILCRDGLVHFSLADVHAALDNIARSESTYLLTTTFVGPRKNSDIKTGSWRALNLERAPFLLPPPLAVIDEHCEHTGGIYRDKRLALWAIAALPRYSHAGVEA
jgi:hypothetical protein